MECADRAIMSHKVSWDLNPITKTKCTHAHIQTNTHRQTHTYTNANTCTHSHTDRRIHMSPWITLPFLIVMRWKYPDFPWSRTVPASLIIDNVIMCLLRIDNPPTITHTQNTHRLLPDVVTFAWGGVVCVMVRWWLWWCGLVVWCCAGVWWWRCGLVECGVVVWWGVVVWFGGGVVWCSVVCWCVAET